MARHPGRGWLRHGGQGTRVTRPRAAGGRRHGVPTPRPRAPYGGGHHGVMRKDACGVRAQGTRAERGQASRGTGAATGCTTPWTRSKGPDRREG